MKKNLVILALLLGSIFMVNGCASASATYGDAKTLEEAHPDRIEKTVVGMGINEFKTVWPEAHRSGMSENSEIYEFIYYHRVYGGYMQASDFRISTYFYFTDNKLVKYESQQKTGFQ